jgi:hypothetical protein
MTRGVLIDIAGLKGVDILPISYEITVADLEQALQKHGLSLPAGVLIYTGWSKPGHWCGCGRVVDQAGSYAAWQ